MQSKHVLVFFHSFLCLFVFADDFMVYVDFDLQWIVLHFMSVTKKKKCFFGYFGHVRGKNMPSKSYSCVTVRRIMGLMGDVSCTYCRCYVGI